jgi:hypothetical protein
MRSRLTAGPGRRGRDARLATDYAHSATSCSLLGQPGEPEPGHRDLVAVRSHARSVQQRTQGHPLDRVEILQNNVPILTLPTWQAALLIGELARALALAASSEWPSGPVIRGDEAGGSARGPIPYRHHQRQLTLARVQRDPARPWRSTSPGRATDAVSCLEALAGGGGANALANETPRNKANTTGRTRLWRP